MSTRILAAALLLGGCAVPPPEAYTSVGGVPGGREQAISLGANDVGETCVQSSSASARAEVYCGTWQQPSARVREVGPATEAGLAGIIAAGSWRTNLDANYVCPAPQSTTLGGSPALQMTCTRRSGGWPHIALATLSGGRAWLADGVPSALPAIAHSVAILSGRERGTVVKSGAIDELQAQRRGAEARVTGDVREYDALIAQGARANLADNPAAAETAYGAALALAEKQFGKDSPNTADAAMSLALQISNQGRFAEAQALSKRAELAAAKATDDATVKPRLLHYEGLEAFNEGKLPEALTLLRRADTDYSAVIPPGALQARPIRTGNSIESRLDQALQTPLQNQARQAILGLIEVRRYQAVALRAMGRQSESQAALASATEIARNAGYDRPELTARLSRARGVSASSAGDTPLALTALADSSTSFSRAYPGSRPQAFVLLLEAAELVRANRPEAAIPVCRASMTILFDIRSGFAAGPLSGCLDAFATVAANTRDPAARQALLRDMFQAAQLVQGSTTSQQIQQASARLASSTSNPAIGVAIREQQDASAHLVEIGRRRQALAEAARDGQPVASESRALDEQERAAHEALASRETDLQAVAPNYDQLVQKAVAADDVLKILKPGEAFAAVTMTQEGGWSFLLRDGVVDIGKIRGGAKAIDPLVTRVRAAMEPTLPVFDTKAAETIFQDVFGDFAGRLDGIRALTVAPTGSLLSLPFGVLLTGPADPGALGAAPWLVRTMAVGHVPSASNFVALRRVSGGSRASKPWFGFGDFKPVTIAQARRSFPAACGDSASLLAGLPPLPAAVKELDVARRLLNGSDADELIGPAFTAAAVQSHGLADYRVLHFATHAVLPSELKCQTEPALITSAPRGAEDASGALLTAHDLAQIKLDAEVVILSACNSGGPSGTLGGGESLSTLARSFFFGGARALLITHWEVSDSAATFIIADTLRRTQAEKGLGLATALRQAQNVMIERAGKGLPEEFSHPFFWAPFALVGQAALPANSPPS